MYFVYFKAFLGLKIYSSDHFLPNVNSTTGNHATHFILLSEMVVASISDNRNMV